LAVRTLALIGTMTLATAVAARVGTAQVAAHQVATQIWLFLAMVIDSLAVAAQALIARQRGAGDNSGARRVAGRLLGWGLLIGTGLACALLALEPLLPRAFTSDPEVLDGIRLIYPFVVIMQPLNALVFVWDGVLMGAEDFRFLAAQMVLSAACAASVLLLVLPLGWGLAGVWWGIAALMIARAVTLGLRYRSPRLLSPGT